MVGPPPPPPPGPPPPPIGGLQLGGAGGAKSGVDPRNALLSSIQKGAKLKKVVTVDKSGPLIQGKISGTPGNSVGNNNSTIGSSSANTNFGNSGNRVANGGPKLGGIFEGMSTMPKLKPVAGRGTFYIFICIKLFI